MCVKDFYGYSCGHCSVPYLRRCPISLSNDMFPICEYPAERPSFTDAYCHPCSRVLWNMKVLQEEEEHRGRHLRGECFCEVMFDADERERRARPRNDKGRRKGKGKESSQSESTYQGGEDNVGPNVESRKGEGECGRYKLQRAPDKGFMRIAQPGTHTEQQRSLVPYSIGNLEIGSVGYSQATTVGIVVDESVSASVGQDEQGSEDHNQASTDGGAAGFHYHASNWNNHLMTGQAGAGMKWYSQGVMPPFPALPPLPLHLWTTRSRAPIVWQKALSEPAPDLEYSVAESNEDPSEKRLDPDGLRQPVVVSSYTDKVDAS